MHQITDEVLDATLATNTKSVAFAFKHQLLAIEKSGGNGSIVVNTAGMGTRATAGAFFRGTGVYAASKTAANMLTQYAVSACLCLCACIINICQCLS
jgi:NAD(P)-dependent dehydrogenase (short-subunit alcohol dehydrogenase family)